MEAMAAMADPTQLLSTMDMAVMVDTITMTQIMASKPTIVEAEAEEEASFSYVAAFAALFYALQCAVALTTLE